MEHLSDVTAIEQAMFGLTAQMSLDHGWGLYTYHVTRRLMERRMIPVLLCPEPPDVSVTSAIAEVGDAITYYHQSLAPFLRQLASAGQSITLHFPILHALLNNFVTGNPAINFGERDVGSIFLEDCRFTHAGITRGRRLRRIIAGSHWNAAILRDMGFSDVVLCHQGVDRRHFHPGPRGTLFGSDRFVVFSGGQLHLRKAQDIVLAAFAAFHQRHPDSLLVTNWHSHWPGTADSLVNSPFAQSVPDFAGGRWDFTGWAARNGVPSDAFQDIGVVPNHQLASVLRSADVGLFPNRCEGGTNLMAMECLAVGMPVILSNNTGQADLLTENSAAYALSRQKPVDPQIWHWNMEGWGESSIEEIVEQLEQVYSRREEAAARGLAGAEMMRSWDWADKADAIIDATLAA